MRSAAGENWCELSPIGAHRTPTGMVRYAIWEYRDAVGVHRIPCSVVAHLRAGYDFTDWRRSRSTSGLLRVAIHCNVADRSGALTETGLAVRRALQLRPGMRDGWENLARLEAQALRRGAVINIMGAGRA